MNKKELLRRVNEKGFDLTEGALRTYTGKKYHLLEPMVRNVGISNEYTEEHVELLCDIFAANRLGISLAQMKKFLKSSNKSDILRHTLIAQKQLILENMQREQKMLHIISRAENEKDTQLQLRELYLELHDSSGYASSSCEDIH